ncbi:MAG: hypothetical protein COT85_02355 [Chlamydiae bacterium CG10_big_fil_rev_8_21_14_0_10_42_34]|nr:MAG: hypothetical protein COT85_02355 [Chlamydiae bacterium CG10_big_fil_rev_8_21_14_0_10_42_34]
MIEGKASAIGTEKYFKSHPIHPSKQRQFDGVAVSALGMGTLLGLCDETTDKQYEETLLQAGQSGFNFFDTANSYRNQHSEVVLGKVIKGLISQGIARDEIVVATKGGFIPFEGVFEDSVRANFLDKKIIESKEVIAESHCMSPHFLDYQISSSLKNLGVETIDLYYLQNPEVQVSEVGEDELYRRIEAAFVLFEKKVHEKKIARYGISSWDGFRLKKGGLDLSRILACAQAAGGENHHFRAIQIPFNLIMMELVKNNKIFQQAEEYHLDIMVSAPLMQGQIKRLNYRAFDLLPEGESYMNRALEFVLAMPQLCSAFCGMRKIEHFEENKKVLQSPSWSYDVWRHSCEAVGVKITPKEEKAPLK